MTSVPFILVVGGVGVIALSLLWTTSRLLRPADEPSGMDPILGARDRMAVYRPSGPVIQPHPSVLVSMPDHLKSREEMVAWMTKEMPKVVEGRPRGAA